MIFKECVKCWSKISQRLFDANKWTCNFCLRWEVKIEEKVCEEVYHDFKWFKLYTSSHLNNKLNINLNSIKNEKCCIKYWDKYILHSDIIEWFKKNYSF